MNENVRDGKLQRIFQILRLIEASSQFSIAPPLPLHISSSNQINGIWIILRLAL